ncbi:tetratricopeptide repeat protein [Plantactinospora sp. WMMB334]|uniref:tetratricopeptide repeat protein n=1 Tax=Plantactinospora sp. WMMB334 TaxID=3404119 RepID=UPI003B94D940
MRSWAHEEWGDGEWARHHAWRESDLHARQGRIDQAIAVLRPHADAGDGHSATMLAALLVHHGRHDELRERASAGDHVAGMQLVRTLARWHRDPEAAEMLQRMVAAGYWPAASMMVDSLRAADRHDEALALLRRFVDAGETSAAVVLARWLRREGRRDEALDVLRPAAAAGDPAALADLTQWLTDRGGSDEAIAALREYVDRGVVQAAVRLAELLLELGRTDEGIELVRSVAHEDETAATRSGVLLGERSRVEDAAAAIRSSPRPLRTLDSVYSQLSHDGHVLAAEAIRHAVRPD